MSPASPLETCRIAQMEEECAEDSVVVSLLHDAFARVHEEVSAKSSQNRRKAHQWDDLRIKVPPWNFYYGSFVMNRSTRRPKHNQCFGMDMTDEIGDTKSQSMFVTERPKQKRRDVVQYKWMRPYYAHDAQQAVADKSILKSENLSAGGQIVIRIDDVHVREK